MKKFLLILLITFSINSFGQNIDKKWDQVIELENESQIKSASEIVQKFYETAVKENDEIQLIKCFFYQSKYLQILDENAQTKIIDNLKYKISKVSIPSKAILNLVYAKCLTDYAQKNKYKLSNRTKVDSLANRNFLQWSTKDFNEEIEIAYKKSLENATELANELMLKYEPVFDFATFDKFKKTSVLEYVLQQNIDRNQNIETTTFNVAFNNCLLGTNAEFLALKTDTLSLTSIKNRFDLIKKLEVQTTVEKEFNRIKFMNENFIFSNDKFQKALNRIQKNEKDDFLIQKIQFEKAKNLKKLAKKFSEINYNQKVIDILDSILIIKNNSNAFKLAQFTKNEITSKTLNIQLQKYTYPNQNKRAFITYKNVDSVKISLYKINTSTFSLVNNNYDYNSKINKDSIYQTVIDKNKLCKSFDYSLVNKKDFFEYTTEIPLPSLEMGNYLVCFESKNVEKTKTIKVFETIAVTNFSVLGSQNNKTKKFQILNRKTGQPIENVKVKNDKYLATTNQKGIATVKEPKAKSNNFNYKLDFVEINKDKDSLCFINGYLPNFENFSDVIINDYQKSKVQLYLDRAIYRPGQTVYYKGIAIQKKLTNTKVISNLLLKIIIRNTNHNEIKEFEVITNEFGSFSGEYVLPKTGLTGKFSIEVAELKDSEKCSLYNKLKEYHPFWEDEKGDDIFEDSSISFRVEEYKRPKFEVKFDKINSDLIVNQSVIVKGFAKAFSGSTLTNALVNYSINRSIYSLKNRYSTNETEIKEGTVKTDSKGNFEIEFIAEPDEDANKKDLPVFSYLIEVDVTDINGETHSAKTIVKGAYHTLILESFVPTKINPIKENTISFNSTNINGEFLAADGEIKIYFKNEFQNKFKKRIFAKPDIAGFTDEEFENLFPNELNEKNIDNEALGTLVFSKKVNTKIDKKLILDFISGYQSGYYTFVLSAIDKLNNQIENKRYFEIIDCSKSVANKLFTIEKLNEFPKTDGFISLKIHSIFPNLYLMLFANFKNSVFDEQQIVLQNGTANIKIPIKKDIYGSVKIGFESIFENELFTESIEYNFEKEVEKIEIETETFRNKIEPGSNEFWSFKLKQKNGLQETEILASMYDHSLDQFTKENWSNLSINEYDRNYLNYRKNICSENITTNFRKLNSNKYKLKLKNEDTKLMWFGFDFNNDRTFYNSNEYKRQLTKKLLKPLNSNWISGYVYDNFSALPGVNVTVIGTKRGTQTDFDGYYEIEAVANEELKFSSIGMNDEKIVVGKEMQYDVTLENKESQLEGIVVTGMGIKKSSKALGYSVTNIKSVEFDNAENTDIYLALAGKAAGVQIGTAGSGTQIILRGNSSLTESKEVLYVIDGVPTESSQIQNLNPNDIISVSILKGDEAAALYGSAGANGVMIITTKKMVQELSQVKARKNLSETAFFLPHLKSDESGKLSFNFTSPEALTEWKLRLLAHNKNAQSGYLEKSIITQKELMVTPNFPRFLREKDSIIISTKIANITETAKLGIAKLQFQDASTGENIDINMLNNNAIKNFNIPAFGNTTVSWKIFVPAGLHGVQYKILAKSGDFSDGEENILPVLTNDMLVTESIPIWVRENSKKEYTFDNLKNNESTTLRNHQFVLEYTSNPAWLAIKSLPYLMEYEHGCAEQTFARFYSNAIASEIIDSNPKIAAVFDNWRNANKLNNKLEENEELKSIILSETPWLNDAKTEDEKNQKLALLFDLEKMKNSQETIFEALKQLQKPSGGFSWFGGNTENEYITRHILAGFGHLKKLSNKPNLEKKIKEIAKTGIPYLDKKYLEDNQKVSDKYSFADYHYLYLRSFYLDDYPLSDKLKIVIEKQLKNSKLNWLQISLYQKAQLGIIFNRFGAKNTAKSIVTALKETASNNEDWGMYWIENKSGWYWYQAPIETQALLIEAFSEITNDIKSVDAMKVWLIKNKQNKNWSTTKATTEAVYALLMQGNNWLSIKDNTIFEIGDEKIMTKKLVENQKEAETGYLKLTWKASEINRNMATVKVENKSKVAGFGGLYWQYFEDLDKIKNDNSGNMAVSKELFIKKTKANGVILEKINDENQLKIGDLITIKLIISAKENMEFVHLKDMRASCFEPINVLSENVYKDNLYYYMSTKDAATHFFFDQLIKGTYLLEYDVRINNSGNFSDGITTIQSMYAPEFSSHTKGIRVDVNE